MDLTYATVPVFGGQERRLYRETRFVKMVTRADCSDNSPIYNKEGDFSCFRLEENQDYAHETLFGQIQAEQPKEEQESGIWTLHFDGANSREGNGAGVLLISPAGKWVPLSFKLEYEATNNVAEYEALLLGLQTARNMGIQCLKVFGDSELVVRQIKNECQTKHPRLRAYRNEVWDMIENFFSAFNIQFMPREQNRIADSLAVAASTFRPPQNPLLRYEVEVR